MNIYTLKKPPFDGYKLGKEFAGKAIIGVPDRVWMKKLTIGYKNELMDIKGKEPVAVRNFPDKYGRGTYTLYYYESDFKRPVMA